MRSLDYSRKSKNKQEGKTSQLTIQSSYRDVSDEYGTQFKEQRNSVDQMPSIRNRLRNHGNLVTMPHQKSQDHLTKTDSQEVIYQDYVSKDFSPTNHLLNEPPLFDGFSPNKVQI